MQSQSVVARTSVSRRATARAPLLERRLARYCSRLQPKVRALAARNTRLADLAISFPALLFALAVPRRNFNPEPVVQSVIAGLPLATLAQATSLPMWTRALPPETFTRAIGHLPDGDFVRRHIANHIPASPKQLPAWLDAVEQAYDVGDERIAAWIAGEVYRDPRLSKRTDRIRRTCLWAWFGIHETTATENLITKRWQASMTFENARLAADLWLDAVDLNLSMSRNYFQDTWLQPATVGELNFIPLKTPCDFAEESAAMENCLDWYGKRLQGYGAKVWSVRTTTHRVATLELRKDACGLIYVYQLCGPKNDEPAPAVKAAVAVWVQTTPRLAASDTETNSTDAAGGLTWVQLWRPYWLAKRKIPSWLPIGYSEMTLNRLRYRA